MTVDKPERQKGTIEDSEKLITELYVELRRKINRWASVTNQTAQARMGYVGQHLVSVTTGYSGSRSGARGQDLILPGGDRYAEIKTCYRVDQLGRCNTCGAAVASIELECSVCYSRDIKRNDDSKWLITIRNDDEFERILDPTYYYLVLFDFVDLYLPTTIRASIWQVEPTLPGFAYCLIDYYKNIKGAAPFNLWPFSLKMDIMRPNLIYRSFIEPNDTIITEIFPGRDEPLVHQVRPLPQYSRSTNLTKEKIVRLGEHLDVEIDASKNKREMLATVQFEIERKRLSVADVADDVAKALYLPEIERYMEELPKKLRQKLRREGLT